MDQNGKDDLKTQFVTREGTYRLITLSEYSRPNRVGYQSNQNNPQVRVSLITLPAADAVTVASATSVVAAAATSTTTTSSTIDTVVAASSAGKYLPHQSSLTPSTNAGISINGAVVESILQPISQQQQQLQQLQQQMQQSASDRICFNFGKELYVYSYRGVKKNVDLCKPIDKKLYKGTSPSCHDFNEAAAVCDSAPLLVGFTTGQIQLVQPGKRETGRLYNEERLIDKTKVTCLKWLPKSPNLFLASHASGHLYLYNEELPCTPAAPNYQNFKTGDGFTILTCKSKSTRNPLYKWSFNTENCSINEFCFSPCGSMLAIVSQDGFLRVFHYDTMELLGLARSYFGGFLCVCWSPDTKYIVVGGEDDLVTVWSLHERRVVARGQGHRSWVSVVAFDPYTSYSHCDSTDFSDDENPINDGYISKTMTTTATATTTAATTAATTSSHYTKENAQSNNISENIPNSSKRSTRNSYRDSLAPDKLGTSYRLGSVGQDTQLCLWDITEDILRQSYEKRHRLGSHDPQSGNEDGGKISKPLTGKIDTCNKTEADSNYNSKFSNMSTKFSTVNAAIGNDIGHCSNSDGNKNSSSSNKFINNSGKTNVMENCVNTIANSLVKNDNTNTPSDVVTTIKNSSTNSKSSESGLAAFNTITQRLSNFSFVNEKKSSGSQHSHKKSFTFSKSTGNHTSFLHNNSNNSSSNSNASNSCANNSKLNENYDASSSLKNARNSTNIVSSYDPLKLIGSGTCPRFDECPLLEPLVCKKIAHERLTALIFREDCFLTACQDGFIYTWARPGYSNIPQHNMSNSPTGPSGGTVV